MYGVEHWFWGGNYVATKISEGGNAYWKSSDFKTTFGSYNKVMAAIKYTSTANATRMTMPIYFDVDDVISWLDNIKNLVQLIGTSSSETIYYYKYGASNTSINVGINYENTQDYVSFETTSYGNASNVKWVIYGLNKR